MHAAMSFIYVTFRGEKFYAATTLKGISRVANASYSALQNAFKREGFYKRERVWVQKVELIKKYTPDNRRDGAISERSTLIKSGNKLANKVMELSDRGLINNREFMSMLEQAEESE